MARHMRIDTSPRFTAVDLARQLPPGSFDQALDHLIGREPDLAGFDARYRNDPAGARAYGQRKPVAGRMRARTRE